jgi:hypothetical protein
MSTDLIIIVPSRGRPEKIIELIKAFKETQTEALLWVAVDDDDPDKTDYEWALKRRDNVTMDVVEPSPNGGMVQALNSLAVPLANASDPPFALGFMGDDHRPRTMHWDQAYVRALRKLGTGIVYGNDLLQGRNLPTQVAMTSDIVRTLGYMAPPTLRHLYFDNWVRELGKSAECLKYLDDVIVEHVHPGANKADWDEGYERVNAPEMWEADKKAYLRLKRGDLQEAIRKVRSLR